MTTIDFGNTLSRSLSPTPRRGGRRPIIIDAHKKKTKKLSLWQLMLLFVLGILCLQVSLHLHVLSSSSSTQPWMSGNGNNNAQQQQQAEHSSWRTMRHDVPARVDGTFNGAPVQLVQLMNPKEFPASRVHCVGSNYQYDGTAWMGRSCHFYFLCLNVTNHRYVVFQSAPEVSLSRVLTHVHHFHVASIMSAAPNTSQAVAVGGVNRKWGKENIPRLKWFPDIINITNTTPPQMSFYALPNSVVLLPYHSLNGANPGHLVWDDFMSLYTLLDMFDLLELEPLLMRYILDDGQRGMWASCDFRDDKRQVCAKMLKKFAPLMMGTSNGYHTSTTQDFELHVTHAAQPVTDLVCAAHGAAGLGVLTDHGLHKSHGWEPSDYEFSHNHGRGGLMRRFRQHVMENIGLGHLSTVPREPPHRIVVSQSSSSVPVRNLKLEFEIEMLQKGIPNARVEPYTFKDLSLTEQLRIAGQAAVYITPCGGGAVTGMFLPPGASIIIYYQHNGGIQNNHGTDLPAMLDWDLFSAMSHLRVHWFPMAARGDYVGQAGLVFLIKHELFLIESLP